MYMNILFIGCASLARRKVVAFPMMIVVADMPLTGAGLSRVLTCGPGFDIYIRIGGAEVA